MKVVLSGNFWNNSSHKIYYRPHLGYVVLSLLLLLLFITPATHADQPTSRLDAYQEFFNQTQITDEASARAFLVAHAKRYQLEAPEKLTLHRQQQSLYSHHYHFQQTFNDLPVDRSAIIVSVALQSKHVVRVHNTTTPLLTQNSSAHKTAAISADVALESVWRTQAAGSKLSNKPHVRLVYITTEGKPQLVYRINMATDTRPGNWEYTLNASTSEILTIERLDTPAFMPKDFQRTLDPTQLQSKPINTPYTQALANFSANNKHLKKTTGSVTRVDGTAQLFDPDPVTTLRDLTLTINSPLESFDAAYVTRPLKDIELADGIYRLNGPWVKMEDTDEPKIIPSTTTDGNWKAKRNESAFQDAMAYYHIDKSQRYLQSLGFANESGIQFAPITVDAQGAFGVHNAFYNSAGNQISFGVAENCPGMAEDADVILHEYGHAIHYSINPNWYGGDTGAMGEGFADYWAGSYALSLPSSADFYPERMGNWIAFNSCWEDGRLLTRTDTRYQQGKIYQAHEKVGDHWSDELWSAPLFQSLRTLMSQGLAREDVDRIILEAHFGLGSEMTMPEMAEAIVITARQMYPQQSYASVFRNSFVQQKILPELLSIENPQLLGTAVDKQIQPDSTLGLILTLHNNSSKTISDLMPVISSTTPGVTLTNDTVLPLIIGADSSIPLNIKAQVDKDISCGSNVIFSTQLDYTDPETQLKKTVTQQFSYLVGEPVISRVNTQPNLKIPSIREEKITSELQVNGLPINPDYFTLHLDLRLALFFSPTITLTSPAGKTIHITGITPWLSAVVGDIPGDFGFAKIFLPLEGENPNGIWTLKIAQPAIDSPPAGLLKSWGISTMSSVNCSSKPIAPVVLDAIQFTSFYLPIASATGNTEFSRGANVKMNYQLRNNSQADISNISVSLSSPHNISPVRQSIPPTTVAALSSYEGQFHFTMPNQAACGSSFPLQIAYRYTSPQGVTEKETSTYLTAGSSFVVQLNNDGAKTEIPDNDTTGITTSLFMEGRKAFNSANTQFHLTMEHEDPADLQISLRSPEGTVIVLVNSGNTLPTYINDKFPDDITPITPLSAFDGENPNGTWVMTIKDTKPGNTGALFWFGTEITNEFDCAPNNMNAPPIATLVSKDFEINAGQTISIDASGSSDTNGDSLTFSYLQTEGPIQALTADTTAKPQFVAPPVTENTTFAYKLIVKDYYGSRAEETFSIVVKKPVASSSSSRSSTASNNSGGGGGGSMHWLWLVLLAGLNRYRLQQR